MATANAPQRSDLLARHHSDKNSKIGFIETLFNNDKISHSAPTAGNNAYCFTLRRRKKAMTLYHPPPRLKDKYYGTNQRLEIFYGRASTDYEDQCPAFAGC